MVIDVLIRITYQTTEECLRGVLRQLLKREPENDDAKRLTMVYNHQRHSRDGVLDWCMLLFDDVKIGHIEIKFNTDNSITTIFTPTS